MTSAQGLAPGHQYFPARTILRLFGMRSSALWRIIVTCGLVCIVCSLALAQTHRDNASGCPEGTDSVAIENAGIPVEVDGRPVVVVYAQIGGFTPQQRAEAIQQRIVALGKRSDISIEAIHAEDRGTWTELLAGAERIMGIAEADAKAAEQTRPALAAEYTEIIRQVVKE